MSTRAIVTREDFAVFLEKLRSDFIQNPSAWENPSLGDFLGAMAAWTRDMEGYHQNTGREMPLEPNWQTFADILNGAKVYE